MSELEKEQELQDTSVKTEEHIEESPVKKEEHIEKSSMKKEERTVESFAKKEKHAGKSSVKEENKRKEMLAFVKKNIFWFAIGLVVLIVLIVVLVVSGKKDATTESVSATDTETEEVYTVDAQPAVNELITNYYTAYANGDTDTIATLASPISENEKSFIQMYSQYVESYQNISCYTKSGLNEGDYLVSVYLEIKFEGVETLAPGLDFFYVQTAEDGSCYINNLYSQYNLLSGEQELDSQISALIAEFEDQSDVLALQTDVQNQYEEAINSDEALATMINTTIYDAYAAWSQSLADASAQETTETGTETADAGDATVTEEPVAEEPQTTQITVYTTDKVNVRDAADTSGNLLGTLEKGTAVTMLGDYGNGWTIVDYNGANAYIKTEYLSADAPSATQTTESTDTTTTNGETVTLSDSCNIRASMSTDGEKIGTAYAGETVTVVEEYAEGWTKVTWNGKTGYIRSDLLK